MKLIKKSILAVSAILMTSPVFAATSFKDLASQITRELSADIDSIANIVIGILFVVTLFVTVPPVIESAKGTEGANGKIAGVIFRVVVIFLFVFVIKTIAKNFIVS